MRYCISESRRAVNLIQESITSNASPQTVWSLWQKASYWDDAKGRFKEGQSGVASGPKGRGSTFTITSIKEGESFTLAWRAPCVKIHVTHAVEPNPEGSKITYSFAMSGFLATPLRLLLKRRIGSHLKKALTEFTQYL